MKKVICLWAVLGFLGSCATQPKLPTYSWEEDLQERIKVDFNRTEDSVRNYIAKYIPDVTDEQMRAWEESGALECMLIDGEKRYFRNAGPNLFRIDSACRAVKAHLVAVVNVHFDFAGACP